MPSAYEFLVDVSTLMRFRPFWNGVLLCEHLLP